MKFGGIEMKRFFKMLEKLNGASVNNIISYNSSMVHALGPTNKCHVTHQVCWNPPPKDFIKINADGYSFVNPGNSDFERLMRNDMRNWNHGFLDLVAELLICWLKMAYNDKILCFRICLSFIRRFSSLPLVVSFVG